ncbi:MAG: alpha/beta hydrolase-fold protein [Spirochaetales bacterium]|nr:alpha/beta hydrolase-fold protein [Spirochaetales bacterium]
MSIKKNTIAALGLILLITPLAFSKGAQEEPELTGVTAITEVIGDGQKLAAVALEYSVPMDSASLDISDFTVTDQEVTAVYLNDSGERGDNAGKGNTIMVEVKLEVIPKLGGPGNRTPGEGGPEGNGAQGGPGQGGPGGPAPIGQVVEDSADPVILTAELVQTGVIETKKGTTVPGSSEVITSTATINPIVEEFQQFVFEDPAYGGKSLMYNLYIPENYDPSKEYPLVMFIHDAGVVSNNPIATLTQGLGAVSFASPEAQAQQESFVLEPQFNSTIVGDGSQTTDDVEITIDLINALVEEYSIDTDRIYNTGQSMGGMTSIAMNIKYPDLFAASWLVACQWDETLVSPMADKPLWIVVSEGDAKAYPGMEAITAELEKYGATVTKDGWDAQSDLALQEEHIAAMQESGTSIYYTVFEGGSHQYTWQYAYYLEGIREWLFAQHK